MLTPELRQAWADVLRDNPYNQIKTVLTDGGNGRCSLGLLAELVGNQTGRNLLDVQLVDEGYLTSRDFDVFAALNDGGSAFAAIANFIESLPIETATEQEPVLVA